MAGDIRDPMVGRDILLGGAATCIGYFITLGFRFGREFGLGEKRQLQTIIIWSAADSFLDWMSLLSSLLVSILIAVLDFLAIFLIVYFFIRNKKATVILSGILLTAYIAFSSSFTIISFNWVFFAIMVSMWMIAFNRCGIVALISGIFFFFSIWILPLSFDPASIVFPQTIATLVIYFAIMAYAAYISIGGAKMFGGKSFFLD